MDKTLIHVIILGVISGLTRGDVVLPALIRAVGETVTFNTTLTPPATPFVEVSWKFGGITIIKSSNESITAPEYEGRITLFRSTGSLQLRSVTVSDSGEYNFSIVLSGGEQKDGTIILSVQVPVSNVVVTPSWTYLVEYFSSVRLSCSSSGSSPYFLWLNGSSEVTPSRTVQLTDGGSTLTIYRLTRYDQGPYRCHAFNPVSNSISDPVTLSISYGPENLNLTVSPSQEFQGEGSDVILTCSADSRPDADFYWALDGYFLSDTGPELRLMNIQMNESGLYHCYAVNPKAYYYRYSTVLVTVLKRISRAGIAPSDPPIEGKPFNFTCDAAGDVFNRTWKWGISNLTLDDDMNLYDNNRVLSFRNLTHKHSGKYLCVVSNFFSSDEAEFSMVVYYGPENIHISGPSEIKLNEGFTLICSAESSPASYSWTLNGTEIHNSAVFTKNSESSDSGNYTCEVMNFITGRTLSAVHRLSVADFYSDRKSGGLSGGAIAGIVLAIICVILASVIVAGGYYIYRK